MAIEKLAADVEPVLNQLSFSLRAGTAVEFLADRALLFSAGQQQIYELNGSSALLAQRLIGGATAGELTSALEVGGLEQAACSEWVATLLRGLAQLNLLEAEGNAGPTGTDSHQKIAVAGLTILLVYACEDMFRLIGPAYAHLLTDDPDVHCTFYVSAAGEFALLGEHPRRRVVVERSRGAVQLKGMILEEVLRAADYLFALHAACLSTGDGEVLILGPPGAGKSTLSLALRKAGCEYRADDVTLVDDCGQVTGVPFAPAAKQGTWEMLRAADGGISEVPTHLRPDGQTVRFLPLAKQPPAASCQVAIIVRLRRSEIADTSIRPMTSEDALSDLLSEARSPDGSCSTAIFRAAVQMVKGARCVELNYAEAAAGAAALMNYNEG